MKNRNTKQIIIQETNVKKDYMEEHPNEDALKQWHKVPYYLTLGERRNEKKTIPEE